MKAIGYARISKDDEKSVSLDYQITDIQRYAKANGFELTGIEVDNGISGKDILHRPGFRRVLDIVESKATDAVIVFKSDRISRNGRESLQIESLFEENKVQYLSVSEGQLCLTKDLNSSRYIDDKFMAYIRAGLNERERLVVGLRTRRALAQKKEKGERISRHAQFGYTFEGNRVVEDPHEQRIINRIECLKADGFSIRAIQRQLDVEGHRNRNNKPIGRNEIWTIIKKAA